MRFINKKLVFAMTAACVIPLASPANARLQFVDQLDLTGTGLGAVPTILTLQSPANTSTEEGAVVANGAGQATVGNTQAQNHLRTFGELQYDSANDIGIVFNPNEPQNGSDGTIRLESLVLSIYNATGASIFNSGAITPIDFTATDTGTGKSGFLFQLDDAQATAAQAAIVADAGAIGTYRIGLASKLTSATGGHETFFAQAIPEPETYAMMIAGLLGLFGVARRKMSL